MPRISRLFSISRRLYGVLLLAVWLGILAAEVLGLRFPLAGKVCYPAGHKHLAVPKQNLRAFQNALKKMGYLLKP